MSPKHARPIDPGPSPVLDVSLASILTDANLNVMEAGTLCDKLREAQLYAGLVSMDEAEDFDATERMWYELRVLRVEARTVFLRLFFEARR